VCVLPAQILRREKMAKTKEMSEKFEMSVSKEYQETAAYYRWMDRGCPHNDDLADWMEIEKELAGVIHSDRF
jgi:hypothetical protein